MAGPVDVFISCARADQYLCEELETHLAGLQRAGVLRTWSEHRISAGEDWRQAVEARLAGAGVVVLLVSADYLASDYLYEMQMTTALARAHAGDARVIPVLLHACDWTLATFGGLAPLPPNGKPVSLWENRHEAWATVVRGIREAISRATAPVVTPEPAYESAEIRVLAEQIERARLRKATLAGTGASMEAIDVEILAMRRRLRDGGQLRAGDALGDGRYLLLHPLGHGGFGAVWAALDRTEGEQVAIKVLHPSQAREASRRERFFRGARVMGSLRHEGVVRVLEPRGEDGGYLYFVMELVAGKDLHRTVVEKRLRAEDVVPLILRVAEALGEAHAQGIVHRDVKPANVVLDASGVPKLTDFDLVAAKDTTGGTKTGAMGTFVFTAPEQMSNAKEADARADVFGLGMTALFCLHGKELPAIVTRKPERVIEALACSEAIKAVVTQAIELEPEKRYADARAFREALRAAAMPAQQPSVSPPVPSAMPAAPAPVAEVPVSAPYLHAPYAVDLARKEQQAVAREAAKLVLPGEKRSPAKVAAVVAGVVATVLGAAAVVRRAVVKSSGQVPDAGSATAAPVRATVSAPATPVAELPTVVAGGAGPCLGGTVPIPAGTFTMGSADGDSDEKPPHQVKLTAFCIDKTEVTVAAYRQCTTCVAAPTTVQSSGYSAYEVKFWSQFCNGDKSDKNTHPINCVDWTQADAYCRWTGGYLPTEAQWEYAARGTDKRKYPWGNEPAPGPTLLNACGTECSAMGERVGHKGWKVMYHADDGAEATAPVGTYPAGASPVKALDMAGNVWEWVADWYAPSYPAEGKTIPEDPKGPDKSPESRRVLRGGGWFNYDASTVRAANRNRNDVSVRNYNVGFRCARGQAP